MASTWQEQVQELVDQKLYHQLAEYLLSVCSERVHVAEATSGAPQIAARQVLDDGLPPTLALKIAPACVVELISCAVDSAAAADLAAGTDSKLQGARELAEKYREGIATEVGPKMQLEALLVRIECLQLQASGKTMRSYADDDDDQEATTFRNRVFTARDEAERLLVELDKCAPLMLDPVVAASIHLSDMEVRRCLAHGEHQFQSGMRYLRHCELRTVAQQQQQALAFSLVVAAVLSPGEFSLAGIVSHKIMDSLVGTERAWATDLVRSLDDGDITRFTELTSPGGAAASCKSFGTDKARTIMKGKILLLAVADLAFRAPKSQRTLPFQTIADRCQVEVNKVEGILMRAMAMGLISGSIDQLDNTVVISHVRPRHLDMARTKVLHERLTAWSKQARTMVATMEELTPELLVA